MRKKLVYGVYFQLLMCILFKDLLDFCAFEYSIS